MNVEHCWRAGATQLYDIVAHCHYSQFVLPILALTCCTYMYTLYDALSRNLQLARLLRVTWATCYLWIDGVLRFVQTLLHCNL